MKLEFKTNIEINKVQITPNYTQYFFSDYQYDISKVPNGYQVYCGNLIEDVGNYKALRKAEKALKVHLHKQITKKISNVLS